MRLAIRRAVSPAAAMLLVLVFCLSCSNKKPVDSREKAAGDLIPAGSLMDHSMSFTYAIYYLPSPSGEPNDVLRQLLAKELSPPLLSNDETDQPAAPMVSVYTVENAQQEYRPPNMQSLQYFDHGLSPAQAEQLQNSDHAFILCFAHPASHVWSALRTANRLVESLARDTGGLIWDEETRELYTPDKWHEKRVDSWPNDIPVISKHTVIHAYQSDEYVRAISLGMKKFGLPDIVVENFSWSQNRDMGDLINLFSQAIAEGAVISTPGQYDLNINEIQNSDVRETQLASLMSDATAIALLSLATGEWEEGDPLNRLVEIGFARYPGTDEHAKQQELLSSLYGWESEVIPVKYNEQILAASRQAKAKLPELQKVFMEGLKPGEYIQVKAPFKTPNNGREWMWVEVTEWEGNNIRGLLKNDPVNIPSLHGGQIVNIKQDDIFDYIRWFADGRDEGNETGKIIKQMQQESSTP